MSGTGRQPAVNLDRHTLLERSDVIDLTLGIKGLTGAVNELRTEVQRLARLLAVREPTPRPMPAIVLEPPDKETSDG